MMYLEFKVTANRQNYSKVAGSLVKQLNTIGKYFKILYALFGISFYVRSTIIVLTKYLILKL